MIWECSKCTTSCFVKLGSRPVDRCISRHNFFTFAEWVKVDGIFLSEVPK